VSNDIHRDLGAHDARLDALEASMIELQADVKYIRGVLAELRGGTRVAWTMAIALGSLVTLVGQWVVKKFGG
jgi:hypothetical protein